MCLPYQRYPNHSEYNLNLGIWFDPLPKFCYNYMTGAIFLPHYTDETLPFLEFLIGQTPPNLTHEILHKWLDEEISLEACIKFDNVDKQDDGIHVSEVYAISELLHYLPLPNCINLD